MGEPAQGRHHLDRALALYDAAEHRALAARFGQDVQVAALSYRAWSHWMLGYPDAACSDAARALKEARNINQAAELMHALVFKGLISIWRGDYATAHDEGRELAALADKKGSAFFKMSGMVVEGLTLGHTGQTENAIRDTQGGISACRSIGATLLFPVYMSYLARWNAELGRVENAWTHIGDALTAAETSKERWWQAETNRIAGDIALMSPEPDKEKAQGYFDRALTLAREQQAKSWELRAAMSMARLWRDQGKRKDARDLLAPVYGWFTEGFDTRDLKEAKVLLDELQA